MARKNPHPIDRHIGSRIRMRRNIIGMSQEALADALDLTFQQVQKYEKGTNRVSGSRIVHIATALKVPVGFFFDGIDQPAAPADAADFKRVNDFLASRIGLDLINAFAALPDDKLQRSVLAVAQEAARIAQRGIKQTLPLAKGVSIAA